MATLIPSLHSCASRMTPGEKRLANRLQEKLEDDYLCWYDVPVERSWAHPDFVILHPRRGLLVLEIKDWKQDTIRDASKSSFTLVTSHGQKSVPNPLEQARQYVQGIADRLTEDSQLRVTDGGRYQGRLCFPYGYGVVLTNISRSQFERIALDQVIEAGRVICQDEMVETVDAEAFQKRLWEMFTVRFPCVLSLPQIDRIRWHLFPEIQISSGKLNFGEESDSRGEGLSSAIPNLIQVMDLQQEQVARNLGEGHRVIHGVAGSGKTLILGYRAEQLAKVMPKPLLVLCYNIALASKLTSIIQGKGLSRKLSVKTFHSWCLDQLRLYNVEKPQEGDGFHDRLVECVIAAVDRGQIPRAQYSAVLIDEGHDFKPEWLKLVAQMVDPATNSVLVLYDDAQSIYGSAKRKFSFASVGIQAQGRTTILRLNYRNTTEVLFLAYEFAKDVLSPQEADEDGVPLVKPESAGRHGPLPILEKCATLKSEADFIAQRFSAFNREGRPWKDMAVVYRTNFIGEELTSRLRALGVAVQWLGDRRGKRFDPAEDSVKVMTMHSSKGLEFPVVAIPGIGFLPPPERDLQDEARLLYVGMTRAMDQLIMTWHKDNAFVSRLMEAQGDIVRAAN